MYSKKKDKKNNEHANFSRQGHRPTLVTALKKKKMIRCVRRPETMFGKQTRDAEKIKNKKIITIVRRRNNMIVTGGRKGFFFKKQYFIRTSAYIV